MLLSEEEAFAVLNEIAAYLHQAAREYQTITELEANGFAPAFSVNVNKRSYALAGVNSITSKAARLLTHKLLRDVGLHTEVNQ